MLQKTCDVASLGKRYILSAMIYAGFALVLASILPDTPEAMAQSGGDCVPGECPAGEQCCDGVCIPDTDVCCEDGTSGPSETCFCCTGCEESECIEVSTVVCDVEE